MENHTPQLKPRQILICAPGIDHISGALRLATKQLCLHHENPMTDIRWHQRLDNYSSALSQLEDAISLAQQRPLSELEKQGLIQAFEFTHELAWNVLKDYFAYQGNVSITGSRDAAREAFSKGLISEGQTWMEMIQSRNQTSHTYNKKVSEEITQKIINFYYSEFKLLKKKMTELKALS